jgi:hypothetical protein
VCAVCPWTAMVCIQNDLGTFDGTHINGYIKIDVLFQRCKWREVLLSR